MLPNPVPDLTFLTFFPWPFLFPSPPFPFPVLTFPFPLPPLVDLVDLATVLDCLVDRSDGKLMYFVLILVACGVYLPLSESPKSRAMATGMRYGVVAPANAL